MNTTIRCPSCSSENHSGAAFCVRCGTALARPAVAPAASSAPAAVDRPPVSRRTKLLYGGIALLLLGAMIVLLVRHLPGGAHPVIEAQPVVAMAATFMGQKLEPATVTARVAGGEIIISLPEVLDKKIVQFDYEESNNVVPLLAFITPEGQLVTSIRLCEPCNSRTYSIDGDEL